jgi:hypothetical protein
MKKILLTFLVSLFLMPLLFVDASGYLTGSAIYNQERCESACGIWTPNVSQKIQCYCPDSKTPSNDKCTCPSNYLQNGCVCSLAPKTGGSTIATTSDASQCLSGKCSVPKGMFGSTVSPSYDPVKGCSCPPGYESKEVDSFNQSRGFSSGSTSNTSGSSSGSSPSSSSSTSTTSGTVVGGSISTSTGNPDTQQVTWPKVTSTGTVKNPLSSSTFQDLLNKLIDWILSIALVVAPLIIVYGGFLHVTAMGEMEKINKGRKIILYASIGFLVALMAKSLVPLFVDLVVK